MIERLIMGKNRIFILLFLMFFVWVNRARAANCGGATPCNCGDTVTADYTLADDMTCTGDCLIVGADGITIDGNGHTITGSRGMGDYGIDNSGQFDGITVRNFADITNFETGIYLNRSTGSTIQNNSVNLNNKGIYLSRSPNSNLTGNTMTGNIINLNIYIDYDNTIDMTNLVEGKPVLYLYDVHGTAESHKIYSGDPADVGKGYEYVGDIGMFWCVFCSYIDIKNATLSANNYYGVAFMDTTNSSVQNVSVSNNNCGISILFSSSNELTDNTLNSNYTGIFFDSSFNNTVTNSTISSNNIGLDFYNFSSASLFNSTISYNTNDISGSGVGLCSNNQFLHNINNKMLTFTEIARKKNLNDTINFDISMFDVDGNPCPDCVPSITTSPSETIISDIDGNDVTGSFTVEKLGTYSFMVTITDTDGNITERNYLFFIGTPDSTTTTYYLRGITPTHGQPRGNGADCKSLLLTAPTDVETWFCDTWVQNSPDDIPNYPLSNLSDVDVYTWYKIMADNFIKIQRFVTYNFTGFDFQVAVPAALEYTWSGSRNFTDLNWAMDYPKSWHWIALKLQGGVPFWATFPSLGYSDQPSYVNFTHEYTTTPAVKSISNTDIMLLSATESADDEGNATIVLDGIGSTDIVLDNYNRPFLGYTTTINSDRTTTLQAIGLTGQTTINSINMEVTPASGSVDINIIRWDTGGNYYKEWEETASGAGIYAEHIVGNLAPNTYYTLKKDGQLLDMCLSDSQGILSFNCLAGSIFSIEEFTPYSGTEKSSTKTGTCCPSTVVYGSTFASEVKTLRRFRNRYLLANPMGGGFVKTYYKISPTIAEFISKHPILKKAVRVVLGPVVWISKK